MNIGKIAANTQNILKTGKGFNSANYNSKTLLKNISEISPQEIGELNYSHNFTEFVNKSYDLIKKCFGIKDDICPKISVSILPPQYKGAYSYKDHNIYINAVIPKIKTVKMFKIISHEFRHVEQLFNGLRIDKNSKKNLEGLAKCTANADTLLIRELATKRSAESIKDVFKNSTTSEKLQALTLEGCRLYDESPELYDKFEKQIFSKLLDEKLQFWGNIQKDIIDTYGTLPLASKTGKKFQKIFDALLKVPKLNLGYFFRPHEKDAYSVSRKAGRKFKSLLKQYIRTNFYSG